MYIYVKFHNDQTILFALRYNKEILLFESPIQKISDLFLPVRGGGSGDSGERSGGSGGGEHSLGKVTGKVTSKKKLLNKISFHKRFAQF